MAGGVQPLKIVGLRELQRDLRAADAALPRELRKINLEAAQLVTTKAKGAASALGGLAAKSAGAIKAQADQRGAAVRLTATAAIPFVLGAEFGAEHNVPRHRTTGTYKGYNQFKEWRGNGSDAGYFLYPTIRASDEEIVDIYTKRLGELLATAFPN